MKVSRNWLQTYFENELPSAVELADILTFHSFEIEGVEQIRDDWVIDIDVLPNRSSDCLSHRGIARELATLLSQPLKRDPLRDNLPTWKETETFSVTVADHTACPRYIGAIMRGVTVGPSPEWLQKRLAVIGQRSINNIVDATNYVMFDVGQPMHAFDFASLQVDENNARHITVRTAEEGEHITTLTGEDYTLAPRHILIADGVSGKALALAGVKGGKVAEINIKTTDLVLESANFNYVSVRKTSRELKLSTDASLRFQNEPARELPAFAMRDLIELVRDIAGGELVGVSDVYDEIGERIPVVVTLPEINNILGVTLSLEDVEKILIRFEWEFSRHEEDFVVTPPWERSDMHIKEDIIEEIGRVYGYRNIIPILPPALSVAPIVNKRQCYIEQLRHLLTSIGYSEVYTYTLQDRGEVELVNPLASDKAFMRRDLRVGLLGALELNANNAPYLGLDTVKIFEIGTVFRAQGEIMHVALGTRAVIGKQSTAEQSLMKDLAVVAEALGVALSNEKVQDGVVELSLDDTLSLLADSEGYPPPFRWDPAIRYSPWSVYPCMYRDIAVWVPAGVSEEEVLAVILEIAPEVLVKHYQFDTFEKDGRVSYAWHLVFQSRERTLTDEEVGKVMREVTDALNKREGWEVR